MPATVHEVTGVSILVLMEVLREVDSYLQLCHLGLFQSLF